MPTKIIDAAPMPDTPVYHKNFTGMLVSSDGVERHFINGAYGREGDLPSVINPDGTQIWYRANPDFGPFNRVPAVPHRDNDLPAIIKGNGDRLYYQFGKLHRDGDQPAIILADGTLKWFVKGTGVAYQFPGCEKRLANTIPRKATAPAVSAEPQLT